ncbi:MAG: cysteine desulfurase family protein [Mariprofundaceae bacterium]|nr:cysteine desulfurase family protein [Mariprofundaceae bacterium]
MSVLQRYLDYNATCPPLDSVLAATHKAAIHAFGNPSSLHWAGRAARQTLDDARDELAAFIGAESGAIVFTSGGTEANNLAIHGWCSAQKPGRVITSAIEHPSVLRPLEYLEAASWEIIRLHPDRNGAVRAEDVAAHMDDRTRLVALMAANNETGAIQPVAEVGAICRERGTAFLVDAVQAMGKQDVDVREWNADFVSLSAHKIGGPRGVGALMIRRGLKINELAPGGGQERKRRSGTENVPGIAGFAAALGKIDFAALKPLRDEFERKLHERLPDVTVFSENVSRTPNTSTFCVPGMEGETLLMQLDLAGFAVASGSACSSGKREASHVLLAMGATQEQARSSIRVSFGPSSTMEDAVALVDELVRIRERLMSMAGAA